MDALFLMIWFMIEPLSSRNEVRIVNLIENLKMSLESIRVNKMRSFLTMLGIIIGISSVITIVSLGQGGQNSITGEFEKIGASTVNVTVDTTKASPSDYITFTDVDQISARLPSVKYASPSVQKQGTISSETKSLKAVITGGNTDMAYINNQDILYGRFFNEREYVEGQPVVVIDVDSAKALFGYENVVNQSIRLGPQTAMKQVTIVGVSGSVAGIFGGGANMPAFVSTPATFLQELYSSDFAISTVTIMAVDKNSLEDAGNGAINVLESRHNNRGQDLYSAENALKQLDQVNRVLGIFTAFIGAVAAISLVVGGIGVMNIMLVSVTERTREIGIRKAIGATTKAIMLQFLTESVIISLIGGIAGMLIGILGAELIGIFANITPSISPFVIIGTILFSSAVGIFFGIYPARKAADLDPIEALRYE